MGYLEFALIFLVAFLVLGPKDFVVVMSSLGRFIGKLKQTSMQFYEAWKKVNDE